MSSTEQHAGRSVVSRDGEVIGWYHTEPGCENATCLEAIEAGRPIHAMPREGTLATYHFATVAEACEALEAHDGGEHHRRFEAHRELMEEWNEDAGFEWADRPTIKDADANRVRVVLDSGRTGSLSFTIHAEYVTDSGGDDRLAYLMVEDRNGEHELVKPTDWRDRFDDRYPLTLAQFDEVERVLASIRHEVDLGETLLEEFSVRPASADDEHSLTTAGELVHYIETTTLDEGGEHSCWTAVGQSGKVYGVDERH